MADARYRLLWPKELFLWEARRVNALPDDILFDATALLLQEAFDDQAVAEAYRAETGASLGVWAPPGLQVDARAWLAELMADNARLIPYVPPRYYAEREGHASAQPSTYSSLVGEFADLLLAMPENGPRRGGGTASAGAFPVPRVPETTLPTASTMSASQFSFCGARGFG